MINKIVRVVITLLGMLLGYGLSTVIMSGLINKGYLKDTNLKVEVVITILTIVLIGGIFFLVTPFFKRRGMSAAKNIESDLRKIPSSNLIGGSIGLIVGFVLAYLISPLFESIRFFSLGLILSVVTYIFLGYLGALIGSQKIADSINTALQGGVSLNKKTTKGKNKNKQATSKILDTSVIIDGRILEILETGFIDGPIIIPEFVLEELRHVADSADDLKRVRGRRGLDILNKIQKNQGVEIYSTKDRGIDDSLEVDIKLLKLAEIINGKVITNDFNLNKVASIQGVDVLNINELANTLKPIFLPGETMVVSIVKEGKENKQGIGYLDDGTMIVIEEGIKLVGKTLEVIVTSVIQTAAGRMIFAKVK